MKVPKARGASDLEKHTTALRIKEECIKLHMTKADLARALDCKPQSVTEWLQAKHMPRPETLAKMAEIFGVEYSYLAAEDVTLEALSCSGKKNGDKLLSELDQDTITRGEGWTKRFLSASAK